MSRNTLQVTSLALLLMRLVVRPPSYAYKQTELTTVPCSAFSTPSPNREANKETDSLRKLEQNSSRVRGVG